MKFINWYSQHCTQEDLGVAYWSQVPTFLVVLTLAVAIVAFIAYSINQL